MSYNRDMPTGNCQKCINTFGSLGCCDTISNEWRYNCDDGMRQFDERKPQTNYDLLVSKTLEEMAEFINDTEYGFIDRPGMCDVCDNHSIKNCLLCWLDWLKSPVEVQE